MRKFHRRIALILGIPLLWIATTGTILGTLIYFRESRAPYRLTEGISHSPRALAQALPRLRVLLDSAAQEGRQESIQEVKFSKTADRSDRLQFRSGETWFFAPDQARPFTRLVRESSELEETLMSLHRGKFFGLAGRIGFSALSVSMLALVASGILIFTRRKQRWTVRDLHRWLSLPVFLPLSVLLLTGSVWNLSSEIRIRAGAPQKSPPPKSVPSSAWTLAVEKAQVAYPRSAPDGVYLVGENLLVIFKDSARVYFNLSQESLVVSRPLSAKGWFESFFWIHSGQFLGPRGILLTLATGLLTVLMGVTGLILTKRSSRRFG